MGLIAQEVQKVAPQAVDLAPFDTEITSTPHDISDKNAGNIEEKKSISGNNYLTVKYDKLVPLLVEAVKEQQKQIDELKQEVTSLSPKI
jgi:trimeric autotransporter adhesin